MPPSSSYGAILLAAGRGARFDPLGAQNKLLQLFSNGDPVVASSAKNLLAAGLRVLAVVKPGDEAAANVLRGLGCDITVCLDAHDGMGASLAHGARQARALHPEIKGWLVALGDMPAVAPATLAALVQALGNGALAARPVHQGRRGNPVAFDRSLLARLALLRGDEGGRAVVQSVAAVEVRVDDDGVLRDVDTPADLNALKIGIAE